MNPRKARIDSPKLKQGRRVPSLKQAQSKPRKRSTGALNTVFRDHLVTQIETACQRGNISHDQLRVKLGPVAERCLATYIADKDILRESEFEALGTALGIGGTELAELWAEAAGLKVSKENPVKRILDWAYKDQRACITRSTRQHTRATIIRAKFLDRLQPTPLSYKAFQRLHPDAKPKHWKQFTSGYQILVEVVHHARPYREIAAERGVSESHVRNMAEEAAGRWARHEGIDLPHEGRLLPFKTDEKDVAALYEALRSVSPRVRKRIAALRSDRTSARVRQSNLTDIQGDYFAHVETMRLERQWTEQDLASKAGIDYSKFQKFKSGDTSIDLGHMERIADAFELDLADMLITFMAERRKRLSTDSTSH